MARDGRGALAVVKDGRDDVLDVRNAHDSVNGAVVDGDAAVAGAPHGGQDLGERRGVLHGGHVNAGDHDLAGDGVAQVNDLVDHGLLLVGQLLGIRDHVLELLLGDVLTLVGGLDAHDLGEAIGRLGGEPDQRGCDAHERADGTSDGLGDALGVGEGDALGNQLAHHRGEVGHDERDDDGCERSGNARGHAEAHEPGAERVGQARCGKGRGGKAHERDGNLDGGQELAGVGREVQGALGAFVPLVCLGF